jgi:hypothetical protein
MKLRLGQKEIEGVHMIVALLLQSFQDCASGVQTREICDPILAILPVSKIYSLDPTQWWWA